MALLLLHLSVYHFPHLYYAIIHLHLVAFQHHFLSLLWCTWTHSFEVVMFAWVTVCFAICQALSWLICHSTTFAPMCVTLCGVLVSHVMNCSGPVLYFNLPITSNSLLSFILSSMNFWDLWAYKHLSQSSTCLLITSLVFLIAVSSFIISAVSGHLCHLWTALSPFFLFILILSSFYH